MSKVEPKDVPPVPLADVTQQGWATTDGLKIFLTVSHSDVKVQETIARMLKKSIDNCIRAFGDKARENDVSWHTSYTTQGLASLLRSLELPRLPEPEKTTDKDGDDV